MQKAKASEQTKISRGFESRLTKLTPTEVVQAVVVIGLPKGARKSRPIGRRQTRRERAKAVRKSCKPALLEIDEIISRFKGQRLSRQVSALGTVAVEVPTAGVRALADSRYVKAILEDQPISSISKAR